MTGTVIEARDVVLSFGNTPALRGADLAVRAGEILAVMGPSGSGKSTLLHCLAGILVPDTGEVHFDGQRIDNLGETGRSALRRDRFGFVFQFGQLVPELTEIKRTGGLVDALLADHGLFHLEADLRWIDLTAARLDALAAEVARS